MGFRIVTGSMGGGKSYYAAEEMLRAIKEGAIVHTNLDIVDEEWAKLVESDDQIVRLEDSPEKWRELIRPGLEGQENVVIVDEGALIFNSQDWAKEKEEKRRVFEFMVYSRHLGLDVLFISQSAKNVDAQIRRMAVGHTHCKKTVEIKPFGFLFASVFGDFRRHAMDASGTKVHDSTWARFRPEIGKLYRTHSRHNRVSSNERDVRRRKKEDVSASRVKKGMVALGCVVAGLLAGAIALGRSAWGQFESHAPAPATAERSPEASQAPGPARVEPVVAIQPLAVLPPAKYEPRRGSGWCFRGVRYVDCLDGVARIGGVYRDGMVVAISTEGEIMTIHLDDGRNVRTRPATRQDFPAPVQKPGNMPWVKPPLPSSPFSRGS